MSCGEAWFDGVSNGPHQCPNCGSSTETKYPISMVGLLMHGGSNDRGNSIIELLEGVQIFVTPNDCEGMTDTTTVVQLQLNSLQDNGVQLVVRDVRISL